MSNAIDKVKRMGWIRRHATQSFKNDLVCGMEYPTPNPYKNRGKEYEDMAFAWRESYDAEKATCEQMGERANVKEIENYLQDAGVV